MKFPKCLTPHLRTLSALLTLSAFAACGHNPAVYQVQPRAEDVRVEPKPVPTPDIVTSAQASARYNSALEAWGERGWDTVGRVCRWANANGGKFDCPPPPKPPTGPPG